MELSEPHIEEIEVEEREESSVTSESSEDGGLTDEQILSTIRTLTQVVEATPSDYQSRVQLIGLLRQQGLLEEATQHRETLATLLPLGESTSSKELVPPAFQTHDSDLFSSFACSNPSFLLCFHV